MNAHTPLPDGQRALTVQQVVMECSEISTFIRMKWHEHTTSIHPELTRGLVPLLLAIARHEPISQVEIICRFGIEKTVVSKQVAQLRSLGLVDAKVSEQDRRVTLLHTTDETKARLSQVREMVAETYYERLQGWSAEDLEHFSAMLHRFNHPEGMTPGT